MNRETIKDIMNDQGILPKVKFGQNFLCDETVISDIVSLCEINREDHILEIGPGLGSITYPISEACGNLTCVEIDSGLAEYLTSNISNAEIINADFIKYEFDKDQKFDVIVSNIPYYVMTDIMKRLFGEFSGARKMVFMVEDEAIARIDCGPNSKQYGPLAILCSLYGKYSYEFKVPYTAFVPQPRTTSAVISFSRDKSADILSQEFVKFLNTCFSMRRKLLKKNLSAIANQDTIDKAFCKLDIESTSRAEELDPLKFAELYKCIIKKDT
ncbi:MAG: 16S rRNA (adenine(1518)-N(6)/adenine(1519)-N(6))-dimethyltransferase RsmA [Saccharofermentans sp.]|nr:16S rRNA (adenine(1518)-N(6)/adenine(1519)-N(6))-dimethyltransferase RsmA [Saccharofermentans sp.]